MLDKRRELNMDKVEPEKPQEEKAIKPAKGKKIWLRILVVCAIFAATAGIVWGLFVAFGPKTTSLGEEYFVSDENKYVVNMPPSENSASVMTRIVYTSDGDKVTGLKTYFEYPDEKTAEQNLESMKSLPEFANSEVVLEGKYVVVIANEDQYKGLTASDAKQQTEAIVKMLEETK